LQLLGGLVGPAQAQDGDGFIVDGDHARPAALGRPVDTLASDHGRRSGDGDLLGVEVDVRPP
jgi:hypothetical protein